MFSASPETIRREPREFDLRRSVGNRQDLAACALCDPFIFLPRRRFLGRRSLVIFCRHEVPFSAIYGEEIRDHLPSYGQRRSIGIPFLLFCFIDQGQIVVLSGRQLRGLHQNNFQDAALSRRRPPVRRPERERFLLTDTLFQ